jgi:enoyl-CoA hydratase/carnithine racemase
MTGQVHCHIDAGVARIVFDRPQARNAMTWAMYEQLMQICRQFQSLSRSQPAPQVRVITFRGAGGQAFVAGTDIEQFSAFKDGEDGLHYEQQIDHCIELLETLPMPTLAICEGWTVGGGLAIATACDFRLATDNARFGVPIARTLGNCLSIANLARLSAAWGIQRVKRMLLLAEMMDATEALHCGFVHQVCAPQTIDDAEKQLVQQLAALAPVTQRVSKEGLRRIAQHDLPQAQDLIRAAYGSADFHEGVSAFVAKRSPQWSGQ